MSSPSFPSGHSLNALVLAGMVAYLVCLRLRRRSVRAATVAAAGSFAVAMGLSRVYLGHHWLTDVLVAWALGLGWLSALIVAHRLWLVRAGAARDRNRADVDEDRRRVAADPGARAGLRRSGRPAGPDDPST